MRKDSVEAVRDHLLSEYRTPSGQLPDVRIERACPGASVEVSS